MNARKFACISSLGGAALCVRASAGTLMASPLPICGGCCGRLVIKVGNGEASAAAIVIYEAFGLCSTYVAFRRALEPVGVA